MNRNIIGGADGPTAVFLAGKLGAGWINIFGLVLVILLLIPNIVYAIRFHDRQNKCTNRAMNMVEQVGRYAAMFLMVFNIGIAEFGYSSLEAFLIYVLGNAILMIAYQIAWVLYFRKRSFVKSMILAVVPVCIFLLCGITLRHVLLIVSGVIFGIGHIYVTYQNAREE